MGTMKPSTFHTATKPILWLLGKWKTTSGIMTYPTLECPLKYHETLCFKCWGQPMLNYSSFAWDPKTLKPIYSETGFLKISNDLNLTVSLISCQNFGVATIEEGKIKGLAIEIATKGLHCIGKAKGVDHVVNAVARSYVLSNDGTLEYRMKMAVQGIPLTQHLHAIYEKTADFCLD